VEVGWLGLAAACLTTGAYFPQAVKSWRSQSTENISLITITALVIGQTLWLIYGISILNLPLIIANMVSAALTATILAVKVRNLLGLA